MVTLSGSSRSIARLLVTSAACTGLVLGCSLTTSLSGLSNGADLPASTAPDGGEAGASNDGGPSLDGSAGKDGGGDAAAALPFCDSLVPQPTFCDDFERTSLLGAWDRRDLSGGGSVTLESSTRTPAGREMLAAIPVFPAGSVSIAALVHTLVDAQVITLSYSLRIDAAPAQGAQQVMLVNVSPSDGSGDAFHTYLFVSPTGTVLVEETFPNSPGTMNTFTQKTLSEPIVFGVWQRVQMTLKLSSPTRVTLTVDGKTSFDDVADPFYRPGKVGVVAGVHYTSTPSGPLSLRVDDLTVDLQ